MPAILRNNRLNIIGFYFFCSSLILLSFFWPFRSPPLGEFYQEIFVFFSILLAAISLSAGRVYLNSSFFLLLSIFLWLVVQWFLGIYVFDSDFFSVSFYFFSFLVAIILGYSFFCYIRKFGCRFFAIFFVFVGLFSVCIAIRQWLNIADTSLEISQIFGRPYANLAQPNHLAALLSLSIASVIYMYEENELNNWMAASCVVLLLAGLVLSQSRTPWVTGVLLFLFWSWKARKIKVRLSPVSLLAWISLYFVVYFCFVSFSGVVGHSTRDALDVQSILSRPAIWLMVVNAIVDGPLMGYGWLQTPVAQLQSVSSNPIPGILTYSHNLYLDLILWNGPLFGVVLCLFLILWKVRLLVVSSSKLEVYSVLFLGVVFIHSMLEYVYAYSYFLLPAGIFLGMLERSLSERGAAPFAQFSVSGSFFKVFFCVLLFALFIVIDEYRYIQDELYKQRIRAAEVVGFEHEEFYRPIIFLDNLEALYQARDIDLEEGVTSDNLELLAAISQRYPSLSNLYRYAVALRLAGKMHKSSKQLKYIRALHGEENYLRAQKQLAAALSKA